MDKKKLERMKKEFGPSQSQEMIRGLVAAAEKIHEENSGVRVTYDVKAWHQTTEHSIAIRAKSADEAMSEALVVLKIPFESVTRMEAKERP
jgi:hypothetical protein